VKTITGKAYSVFHRVLGLLAVLMSLTSIGTILPLVVTRLRSNPSNALFLAVIVVLFVFLAIQGIDLACSTVSLDSDGLTYRALRKQVHLDWVELCTARTSIIKGVHCYVAQKSSGKDIWVPCADAQVRQVVGVIQIETEIKRRANKQPEGTVEGP